MKLQLGRGRKKKLCFIASIDAYTIQFFFYNQVAKLPKHPPVLMNIQQQQKKNEQFNYNLFRNNIIGILFLPFKYIFVYYSNEKHGMTLKFRFVFFF